MPSNPSFTPQTARLLNNLSCWRWHNPNTARRAKRKSSGRWYPYTSLRSRPPDSKKFKVCDLKTRALASEIHVSINNHIHTHIFSTCFYNLYIYIYSYTCLYPCILVKNWGNSWHGIFLLQNSNLPLVKSPFPSETSSPATETSSISWAPIVHLWRWKIFFVESSRHIS